MNIDGLISDYETSTTAHSVKLEFVGSVLAGKDNALFLLSELQQKDSVPSQLDFQGVVDAQSSFLSEFFQGMAILTENKSKSFPEIVNLSPELEERVNITLKHYGIQVPSAT